MINEKNNVKNSVICKGDFFVSFFRFIQSLGGKRNRLVQCLFTALCVAFLSCTRTIRNNASCVLNLAWGALYQDMTWSEGSSGTCNSECMTQCFVELHLVSAWQARDFSERSAGSEMTHSVTSVMLTGDVSVPIGFRTAKQKLSLTDMKFLVFL